MYLSPRPSPSHANASSALGSVLNDAYHQGRSGPGGWWILFEPELHLDHDVIVPDICGWRRERLPELPQIAWFELAPDWVCEVISPSAEAFDREEKLPRYAHAGVEFLWLVEPGRKLVEVFRRSGSGWTPVGRHTAQAQVVAPPFDAIVVDLGSLWA